jgi:hypothetical protein
MNELKFSNYDSWTVLGDPLDYIEIRLGESYAFPVTVFDNSVINQAIDVSAWSFTVTGEIFTMNTDVNDADEYGSCGCISTRDLLTDRFQSQMGPFTAPQLQFEITDAVTGLGVLKIPASATPNPSELVSIDGHNTLLNIITITANYPSVSDDFTNTAKLELGLVVRYGGL